MQCTLITVKGPSDVSEMFSKESNDQIQGCFVKKKRQQENKKRKLSDDLTTVFPGLKLKLWNIYKWQDF